MEDFWIPGDLGQDGRKSFQNRLRNLTAHKTYILSEPVTECLTVTGKLQCLGLLQLVAEARPRLGILQCSLRGDTEPEGGSVPWSAQASTMLTLAAGDGEGTEGQTRPYDIPGTLALRHFLPDVRTQTSQILMPAPTCICGWTPSLCLFPGREGTATPTVAAQFQKQAVQFDPQSSGKRTEAASGNTLEALELKSKGFHLPAKPLSPTTVHASTTTGYPITFPQPPMHIPSGLGSS